MSETWLKTNQKYLVANINQVKTLLKHNINRNCEPFLPIEDAILINEDCADDVGLPSIESLSLLFGLSPFEKQIIVLCAAQELDSEVRTLLAEAHGNPNMNYLTFSLALSCFPKAHWSAIVPTSPLRRFQLLEVNLINSANSITNVPLRISERVLHYLTGIFYLDRKLHGIIKPVPNYDQPVESHTRLVDKILSAWHNNNSDNGKMPAIQLCGVDETDKLTIAQTALAANHLSLWQLSAELIPQKPREVATFAQLWTREAALLGAGLFITTEDTTETPAQKNTLRFIEQLSRPIFLSTKERWQIPNNTVTLQVNKPLKTEQRQLWQTNIKNQDTNLQNIVSALVNQFNFNASTIKAATNEATLRCDDEPLNVQDVLWESACVVSRPKFFQLAQQITPKATLDGLVLPEREKSLLQEIIVHVAQRHRVYEDWGFEDKSSRGLGISALFCGSSGTGKTMAAEVIAHELHLDLFRIDLSAVVSKYIGETEKNLCKLFDAAEDTGAILFFDEADALFGKRTEVKDSHDRHANIEINYMLQRMENYRGLAILATNMRDALDNAFIRRLKFIINFPFPDEKSRLEIWQNIFPQKTPLDNLNFTQLSKLNISGGNIRNIAIYSAFLAANQNIPINMQHIKRATQAEYTKMEKPLPTGNWHHHENQS
jgi:AAA+ superfamily predicted ATPase